MRMGQASVNKRLMHVSMHKGAAADTKWPALATGPGLMVCQLTDAAT